MGHTDIYDLVKEQQAAVTREEIQYLYEEANGRGLSENAVTRALSDSDVKKTDVGTALDEFDIEWRGPRPNSKQHLFYTDAEEVEDSRQVEERLLEENNVSYNRL